MISLMGESLPTMKSYMKFFSEPLLVLDEKLKRMQKSKRQFAFKTPKDHKELNQK